MTEQGKAPTARTAAPEIRFDADNDQWVRRSEYDALADALEQMGRAMNGLLADGDRASPALRDMVTKAINEAWAALRAAGRLSHWGEFT